MATPKKEGGKRKAPRPQGLAVLDERHEDLEEEVGDLEAQLAGNVDQEEAEKKADGSEASRGSQRGSVVYCCCNGCCSRRRGWGACRPPWGASRVPPPHPRAALIIYS